MLCKELEKTPVSGRVASLLLIPHRVCRKWAQAGRAPFIEEDAAGVCACVCPASALRCSRAANRRRGAAVARRSKVVTQGAVAGEGSAGCNSLGKRSRTERLAIKKVVTQAVLVGALTAGAATRRSNALTAASAVAILRSEFTAAVVDHPIAVVVEAVVANLVTRCRLSLLALNAARFADCFAGGTNPFFSRVTTRVAAWVAFVFAAIAVVVEAVTHLVYCSDIVHACDGSVYAPLRADGTDAKLARFAGGAWV